MTEMEPWNIYKREKPALEYEYWLEEKCIEMDEEIKRMAESIRYVLTELDPKPLVKLRLKQILEKKK